MRIVLLKTGQKVAVDRFATFEFASRFALEHGFRLVRGDDECLWALSPSDLRLAVAAGYEEVAL